MTAHNFYNADQAHAKLSASGADRWMLCGGSVQAEEGLPDDSNIHAEQGTIAHELGDICLKGNQDADEYIGRWIFVDGVGIYGRENPDRCQLVTPSEHHRLEVWKIEIDDEMADNVQLYLDYVRSYLEIGSLLMPERRVSFAHVVPEGFGTSDAIMLHPPRKHMDIFDLKYGFIPVVAEGNRQGRCYGVGSLAEFDMLYEFDTVTIHIVQPRVGQRYSSWELTRVDLEKFADEMQVKSAHALSGDGIRVAGEKQCMWCKARDNCGTRMKWVEGLIGHKFEDLSDGAQELKEENMTHDARMTVVAHKTAIEGFLRDIYDGVERTALAGGDVGSEFKVVRSRTNRKLTKRGKLYIEHHLGDEAFKPKTHIGIGAALKGVGKAKMTKAHLTYIEDNPEHGLWVKPEGRLTMAKASDSREEVIVEGFTDLTEQDTDTL